MIDGRFSTIPLFIVMHFYVVNYQSFNARLSNDLFQGLHVMVLSMIIGSRVNYVNSQSFPKS